MNVFFEERVAYGRIIRERAACLVAAHGVHAEAEAREAANESGAPMAERNFWSAVAARVARESAATGVAPLD